MDTNTPENTPLHTPEPSSAPSQRTPDAPAAFLRRHAVGSGITAAVLAVVVVAGGTAWGVSAAVAAEQTSASAPLTAENASNTVTNHGAAASTSKAKAKAKAKRKHRHGAVGTITAISGDTWTMHAASGATVTVKLSSSTAYGTKKKPATEGSFAVGDRIGALGTRSGDTVTAKRIVHLPVRAHAAAASSAATPGT
ncbi:DUF5666 domain-containing protein [Leifsonia sp. Le1]|uniref:DUF5666 domain-containing protein n=1 Tax=Leifsonia sp. Le1 TaxID=3404918 RepID=UPI003EB8DB82